MKKTKFLIIRFSSIGDIVLTSPVIRCIKLQYPNAEVHFVSKKQFKVLLENNPYLDKIHLLEGSLSELKQNLARENFDYIIDLHHNLRSWLIKLACRKAQSFSFDKLNFQKWLLVNLKMNQMPDIHIVDRYMACVKSIGIENDNKGLDYFIPEKDFFHYPEAFITFAIGGQHATKKLPNDKIIDICQKINSTIVLLGGKEDEANATHIQQALGEKKIINFCGKLNLNQSASLIKQSQALLTHDTGLMHIAAALKQKTIAIWGNTTPDLGMYPYQTEQLNFEVKNLSCRPCSKIGFASCPKKHFKCMNLQDSEKISEAVRLI